MSALVDPAIWFCFSSDELSYLNFFRSLGRQLPFTYTRKSYKFSYT